MCYVTLLLHCWSEVLPVAKRSQPSTPVLCYPNFAQYSKLFRLRLLANFPAPSAQRFNHLRRDS